MFGLSQEATVGNLFSNGVSTLVSTNDIDLHEFPCSIKNGWYNNMFDMPQAATVGNPFSNDVSTLDNDIDLHEFPNEKFMRFEGPVESAGQNRACKACQNTRSRCQPSPFPLRTSFPILHCITPRRSRRLHSNHMSICLRHRCLSFKGTHQLRPAGLSWENPQSRFNTGVLQMASWN